MTQNEVGVVAPRIEAVIFDVGGVLTTAPGTGVRRFTTETGVPFEKLVEVIMSPEGAWSRFETGVMTEAEFIGAFEGECVAAGFEASARAVLDTMADSLGLRDDMIDVVRGLRGSYRLGCITNVVGEGDDHTWTRFGLDLDSLFDTVLISAEVGLRKPDPRIYELACQRLGVQPEHSVFLDDSGANLKAARALGMVTIKVDEGPRAIDELNRVLGVRPGRIASQQPG